MEIPMKMPICSKGFKLPASFGFEGLSMVASSWEKTKRIMRNMLDGVMHVRNLFFVANVEFPRRL